jgi:hypothetical protein
MSTASAGSRLSDASATSVASRSSQAFQLELDHMHREREAVRLSMSNITVSAALSALKANHNTSKELIALVEQQLGESGKGVRRRGLGQKFSPSGGLAKARDMINEMINEINRKLDRENTECSDYFKEQCTLMETCRSDISGANAEAAMYRGKVLKAQEEINICERRLPRLKYDLQENIHECNTRLSHLQRDLNVVLGDIQVMNSVLALTECDKESFLQFDRLHIVECKRRCKKGAFLTLHHDELNEKLAEIKSPAARKLIQDSLAELARQPSAEMPTPVPTDENGTVLVNVTVWENPPLTQTALPDDPCQGITYDAGGEPGCTLRTNPHCFNLQNKFMNIQGEIVDKRDELLMEISHLTTNCEMTQRNLKEQIERFEARHDTGNSLLAESTSGEDNAAEEGREKSKEHEDLKIAMFDSRTSCTEKMRQYESELCSLRKIRGELFKLKGDQYPFFQDCEVADWEPEECSKSCGGGTQEMHRSIVAPHSGGGAQCPPTRMVQACNQHPCPIDCEVGLWSGWSMCSTECGGGVQERVRKVNVFPRYDGDPCGELTETRSCNMQDCDKECVLGEWGEWSGCSKACGGGISYSRKTVKVAAVGDGECPSEESARRLDHKSCNTHTCPTSQHAVLKCEGKVDLVLMLDGSDSLGEDGWTKVKQFADRIVEAFHGTQSQVAIILFSGPRSWPDYEQCVGSKTEGLDMESVCGLKMVQHFSNNTETAKENIAAMSFPRASTFTAGALEMARAELTLGRHDATRVVFVATDGLPISQLATGKAVRELKQTSRVMFGAVGLDTYGLERMQEWGSKPTHDNVLALDGAGTLAEIATVNAIIRDMCPGVRAP